MATFVAIINFNKMQLDKYNISLYIELKEGIVSQPLRYVINSNHGGSSEDVLSQTIKSVIYEKTSYKEIENITKLRLYNSDTITHNVVFYLGDLVVGQFSIEKNKTLIYENDKFSIENKETSSSSSSITDEQIIEALGYTPYDALNPNNYITSSALTPYILTSQKGVANGVVPLDAGIKINSIYLPSYVDDVLEFADLASFPGTGETGKIYVALDSSYSYRWSGSSYVELTSRSAVWGSIEGDIADQVDVVSALGAKQNSLTTGSNLQYFKGDLSLGTFPTAISSFSNDANFITASALNPVLQSVASASTVTPTFSNDLVIITALAVDLIVNAPTGTAIHGKAIILRIKDSGTARGITWDSIYRAIGVTLPTITVANKTMYLGMIYNGTDSKWDVIGYNIEA